MRQRTSGRTDREADADELVARIYREVGEAMGIDPTTEPIPVLDAVDPAALERAFNDDTGETYVSFPLRDRRVTVHSDGEVLVHSR